MLFRIYLSGFPPAPRRTWGTGDDKWNMKKQYCKSNHLRISCKSQSRQ